jgi:hypothetical protein
MNPTISAPSIHFGFEPDPQRAHELDARMHMALAASIEHLRDVARDNVHFDEKGIDRLIASLRYGNRFAPMLFRDYYALADALYSDDEERAAAHLERLARSTPVAPGLKMDVLRDPEASEPSRVYHAMLTGSSDVDIGILPPSDEVASEFFDRFQRGMDLMQRAIPELADEVRAIIREVVCVVGDPARKMQFDGGSHFQLWGALFLNADFHPTPQAIVEVVAHESAHSLLFGFCTDEPLVFNDDDELYASPLRSDPRPMDGIYHATFVSARMHWAMSRLLESGELTDEGRRDALAAREADRKNFEAGYHVVAEHAELSDTGARLMEGARAYIDRATA